MQETQRPSLIARFKGEATTGAPAPETSTGPEHTTATPHTVKIGDKLPFDKVTLAGVRVLRRAVRGFGFA